MTYRAINDSGWKVQKLIKGEWQIVFYCRSKEAANQSIDRCKQRDRDWEKLTPEERRDSILRSDK